MILRGIVKGASEGEGLGNKFLAIFVRRTLSPRLCVRLMTRTSFTWTARSTPPPTMETINTELILADLQTLENAIPRLEKAVKIKKG